MQLAQKYNRGHKHITTTHFKEVLKVCLGLGYFYSIIPLSKSILLKV